MYGIFGVPKLILVRILAGLFSVWVGNPEFIVQIIFPEKHLSSIL
jgi:hypothetical protein